MNREIDTFVKQMEKISDDPDVLDRLNEELASKKTELVSKYNVKLHKSLEKLMGQYLEDLSPAQRVEMTGYLVDEMFKEPLQEKLVSDMLVVERGISIMGIELVPPVFATCNTQSASTQPDVVQFKQLQVDINGKAGFDGDNALQTVKRYDETSCMREYTLTFKDEDHPYLDVAYDQLRQLTYGRIHDIEKFYVIDGKLWFPNTGSKSQTFWTVLPIHYQESHGFYNTVYVSNTWNHLMSPFNNNPSEPMKTWYK